MNIHRTTCKNVLLHICTAHLLCCYICVELIDPVRYSIQRTADKMLEFVDI